MPESLPRVLLVLLLACLLVPAAAQEPDQPLFIGHFDGPELPADLLVTGGQTVLADGALTLTASNAQLLVVRSGRDWTDYALEVRFLVRQGRVWLQVRAGSDLCSGYYFAIETHTNSYSLSVADSSCHFRVLETQPGAGIQPHMWMMARLEVEGSTVRALVEDEIIFSVTDFEFTQGYPAVSVIPVDGRAEVIFSSIYVLPPGLDAAEAIAAAQPTAFPTDTPQPTVTPEPPTATLVPPTVTPVPPTATPEPPTVTPEPPTATPVSPTETAEPTVTPPPPTATAEPTAMPTVAGRDDGFTMAAAPPALEGYSGLPEDVVAALRELGLAPEGGRLLFTERFVGFERLREWVQPLGDGAQAIDFVLAGELTFYSDPGALPGACTFSTRMNRSPNGILVTYVDVGLINQGDVFILDRPVANENPTFFQLGGLALEPNRPQHLLLVVVDGRATAFVNGTLAFDRVPVVPRGGEFGLALISNSPGQRCEARNVWAFTLR